MGFIYEERLKNKSLEMCFCLRQTDVNKLYLHRTRIAHALLHLLAAAGEKRQHTESTV